MTQNTPFKKIKRDISPRLKTTCNVLNEERDDFLCEELEEEPHFSHMHHSITSFTKAYIGEKRPLPIEFTNKKGSIIAIEDDIFNIIKDFKREGLHLNRNLIAKIHAVLHAKGKGAITKDATKPQTSTIYSLVEVSNE